MISLRWSYLMAVLLAGSAEPGRAVPQRQTEKAVFVGEYRSVRDEYTFELWRVNGRPVAVWGTARVSDLQFGPDGMISFFATSCDVKESFAGELSDVNLEGTLLLSSRNGAVDRKIVALVKDQKPGLAASLPLAEWSFMIEGRLRRDAPDCSP